MDVATMRAQLEAKYPLVTVGIAVGERVWNITCVQDQDALLDFAEELEHFPYGFLLWEASVALAPKLAANPNLVAGKRVLELGAGVGLPGIVARSLGAEVWQTDHQARVRALAGAGERGAKRHKRHHDICRRLAIVVTFPLV